jgi:adenosylcobinamide-GDP ribazoletransferase
LTSAIALHTELRGHAAPNIHSHAFCFLNAYPRENPVEPANPSKPTRTNGLQIAALAFSFLTILPVPSRWLAGLGPADMARSFALFPLVGLVLAGISVLPAYLLSPKGAPLLHASLIAAILCLLTRALHLDGLADVADGFGGGYTPERRMEIMKDSRTGAFGVAAIVFIVLIKVSALEILVSGRSWAALCSGPVLARFAMVASAYGNRYARKEGGLGKSFVEHISAFQMLAASVLTLALCCWLSGVTALLVIVILLCFVAVARYISNRMIGGVTGDVLGAINEISEALTWTVLAFALP